MEHSIGNATRKSRAPRTPSAPSLPSTPSIPSPHDHRSPPALRPRYSPDTHSLLDLLVSDEGSPSVPQRVAPSGMAVPHTPCSAPPPHVHVRPVGGEEGKGQEFPRSPIPRANREANPRAGCTDHPPSRPWGPAGGTEQSDVVCRYCSPSSWGCGREQKRVLLCWREKRVPWVCTGGLDPCFPLLPGRAPRCRRKPNLIACVAPSDGFCRPDTAYES